MSVIIQGYQLREIAFGVQVQKSWTLPASATTNTLFTVAGGSVLVTALLGNVTTLIGSTTTSLALGTAPTTGTLDVDGIATSSVITSAEKGSWFGPQASSGIGGALAGTAAPLAGSPVFVPTPFVVAVGTITATTTANAGGGVINWYLHYVPLDTGASVS